MAKDISIQSVCQGGTKRMQTICINMFVSDWCITILAHGWWVSIQSNLLALRDEENGHNALDRNPPTMSDVCDTQITNNHSDTNSLTQ